jgi:hypothetical protein
MQTITTYKEYLECKTPENVSSICIKNWSIYTYITIDETILKFKNLNTLNINFFEINNEDLLFYILHNISNIDSKIIIYGLMLSVNISNVENKNNSFVFEQITYPKRSYYEKINKFHTKILQNLPSVDTLVLKGIECVDHIKFINLPATVRNVFLHPYDKIHLDSKIPFGCNIYYKFLCPHCIFQIINK